MSSRKFERGLGVIEILVSVAIGSIVIGALVLFMGRAFGSPRTQFEQSRITEEARIEMERISDTLRNATYVDFNGDGLKSAENEVWLQSATPNSIAVYSNVDADNEVEEVRYSLFNNMLIQEIFDPAGGVSQGPVTLARSFRNADLNEPLFTYYSSGGDKAIEIDPIVHGLSKVERIAIHFVIDVDVNQEPDAAVIDTEVTPRKNLSVAP